MNNGYRHSSYIKSQMYIFMVFSLGLYFHVKILLTSSIFL